MAHPAARQYADALYELASEQGVVDDVAAQLNTLRESMSDADGVLRTMMRPRARQADLTTMLREKLSGAHASVRNTLFLLVEKGRQALVLDLLLAFFERLETEKGITRVLLEIAQPLDADQLERIATGIGQATGRTIAADVKVVPELIGGIRVTADSRRIDATVRRKMERLGAQLRAAL